MPPLSTGVTNKNKPIGLENDDNHCWFNAMLQSLEACSTIQSLFQVYRNNIVQHVRVEKIVRSFSDFLHNRANEKQHLDTLHFFLLDQIRNQRKNASFIICIHFGRDRSFSTFWEEIL
mmetsp:Transcript_10470/g.19576  ORF Transcript_10470/g.19576 Transcript_10470/m.19576 type:complete len:118 (-) Transcript_10470:1033-1386(-)